MVKEWENVENNELWYSDRNESNYEIILPLTESKRSSEKRDWSTNYTQIKNYMRHGGGGSGTGRIPTDFVYDNAELMLDNH